MAVIENYSSNRPLPVRQSNAQDFADTRGLENLAQAAEKSSQMFRQEGDRLAQVQEIEDKLVIARKMAEFDQQWVIEINNRRQAVEEGRMSASGMTEAFQKDYGKASDELAATIPNRRMSEETRIRLIERQTSMIGSLMDFEARKRAEGIKKNYDGMLATYLNGMATASTPEEVEAQEYLAAQTISSIPDADLVKESLERVKQVSIQKKIMMAETPAQAEAYNQEYMNSGLATDQGALTIGNMYVDKKNTIEREAISVVQSNMTAAYEMASVGMLNPGALTESFDAIPNISDENIRQEISTKMAQIQSLNIQRKAVNQSQETFNKTVEALNFSLKNEASPDKQKQIASDIAVLVSARKQRDEMMAKDPAFFANNNSDSVILASETYAANPTEENREKYYASMDNYFHDVGYNGPVNYLTADEANSIVGNLKKSILKENGVKEVEQQIAQMTQTYGKRIGPVMQQLIAVDKDVMPATMVARIAMNGGDRNKALDIIKAVSAINTDPKPYDLKDKDIPTPQGYSDVISAMTAQDMVQENQERRESYEALYKYYKRNNVRNPEKAAADVVYSDMKSDGTIIVPAAYKSVSDIVNRANKTASDFISKDLIEMPELTNQFSKQDILSNPAAVIEWRNMPDGEGIQAVWAGSNGNPVYDKFGNRLQYKYMQYDIDLAENPIVQSRPSTGFKSFNEDAKERQ